MLLIEDMLTHEEARHIQAVLSQGPWQDGRETAGSISRSVKQNLQRQDDDLARQLGEQLRQRISQHPRFVSAALAKHISRPRFNAYRDAGHYGMHIDSALMRVDDSNELMRCDLSYTLFLSDPDQYLGGELCIQDALGSHRIKAPAGSLLLYPASSWHQVLPVTQGQRVCAIGWIQSVVKHHDDRLALFDLDESIQQLAPSNPVFAKLTGVYNNLLRRFCEF